MKEASDWFIKRTEQVRNWEESQAYYDICVEWNERIQAILSCAYSLWSQKRRDLEEIKGKTLFIVYSSDSNMHRGYYNPSHVFDIVVGNAKRGKTLKRITSKSKNYYRYGFDENSQLIWAERYYKGNLVSTEYIIDVGSKRVGITWDATNDISAVTEEQYCDGRLVAYTNMLTSCINDRLKCYRLRCEEYHYDNIGLESCITHIFCPPKRYFRDIYCFERKDGLLFRYTANTYLGETCSNRTHPSFYDVHISRRA